MKEYHALVCYADRETLDLVVALSGTMPITGVLDDDASVVLYFERDADAENATATLRSMLPPDTELEFERSTVEEQNWNAEFEQSLAPVRIADGLLITQSWNRGDESSEDLVVVIDPKMSFGTGHHESTRLIARLLMNVDLAGRRVLDAGTGTGVLAIVAARRGATHVVAFDNNEWATANTIENLQLNDAGDDVVVLQGELEDVVERDFDVIVANMHRNIIIELLPGFVGRFGEREAILLTSGVLIVDYDGLLEAAAAHGLHPTAEERENDWVATRFERNNR